ncbi:MAG: LuxR C-terminal-related transcriptional regulator [Alphaproteobacteria bacterium]|nr:LuxR C-terminal-related transcriptional regulator [Alphaproteobacteria bacterium]
MNVSLALSDIEACTTLQELRETMRRISENYGFASFNFIDVGTPHVREPFYLGTCNELFVDTYAGNEFVKVDPCVSKVRRTNLPFVWADVMTNDHRRGPKSGTRRLMDAATDFGFSEGLVIPCHFRDALGRNRSASSVFYWSDPVQRFQFLLREHRRDLHLLMIYFVQTCLEIRDREIQRQNNDKRPTPLAQSIELTDRERDVLAWAAQGKTTAEIASILGLSGDTVDVHFRNNIRKLQASNRTQAVAKALVHGLIDI